MAEIESLEIKVSVSGVDEAKGQIESLTKSLEGIKNTLSNFSFSFGATIKTASKELQNQVDKIGEAINGSKELEVEPNIDTKEIIEETEDITEETNKQTESIRKNNRESNKGMLLSLKRIAIYRALRTLLKQITQGLKEGMDALYQYDKTMGSGEFSSSLDKLASSLSYLKSSIAVVISPLVSLEPILTNVIDILGDLANELSKVNATLLGNSNYFITAKNNAVKYNQALKSLGFDELNTIGDSNQFNFQEQTTQISQLTGALKPFIETIKDIFGVISSTLKSINIEALLESVVSILKPLNTLIDKATKELDGKIQPLIADIVDLVTVIFNLVGDILNIIEPILEPIVVLVADVISFIEPILRSIVDMLGDSESSLETIGELLKPIAEIIGFLGESGINDIFEALKPITDLLSLVNNIVGGIIETFTTFVSGGDVWATLENRFESIKDIALDIVTAIINSFIALPNIFIDVISFIINALSKVWQPIADVVKFISGGSVDLSWNADFTDSWGIDYITKDDLVSTFGGSTETKESTQSQNITLNVELDGKQIGSAVTSYQNSKGLYSNSKSFAKIGVDLE